MNDDVWENVRPITKVAGVFFLLGKLMFIPAGMLTMAMMAVPWAKPYALISICLYALFIFSSAVLSIIGMMQIKTKDKKDKEPPSREQVEEWMKHYYLLEPRD